MKTVYSVLFMGILTILVILTLMSISETVHDVPVSHNVEVDFGRSTGKTVLEYGTDESNNWQAFSSDNRIHELHKDLDDSYIRVWVYSLWYMEKTIPLNSDGTYDYTNLDSVINAVLKSGALPYITIAHAPGTYGEGHGEAPPEDIDAFTDYVQNIAAHYKMMCDNHWMYNDCDVNDWYFELWNEPYNNPWWEGEIPLYSTVFNKVKRAIGEIVPQAKVGGFTLGYVREHSKERLKLFINNSQPDFIAIHHYGNLLYETATIGQKMEMTKTLYYDSILELRQFLGDDMEIIISEYNSDYRAEEMKNLDDDFNRAWTAATLIWLIKSKAVSKEFFYAATSGSDHEGFGLWSISGNDIRTWPTFDAKRLIGTNIIKGSKMYYSDSAPYLSVLAAKNSRGTFIIIANLLDRSQSADIKLSNSPYDKAMLDNWHNIRNNQLSVILEPYEVMIIELK